MWREPKTKQHWCYVKPLAQAMLEAGVFNALLPMHFHLAGLGVVIRLRSIQHA